MIWNHGLGLQCFLVCESVIMKTCGYISLYIYHQFLEEPGALGWKAANKLLLLSSSSPPPAAAAAALTISLRHLNLSLPTFCTLHQNYWGCMCSNCILFTCNWHTFLTVDLWRLYNILLLVPSPPSTQHFCGPVTMLSFQKTGWILFKWSLPTLSF